MYCDDSYRRLFQNFVETKFINDCQMTKFLSDQVTAVAKELFIGRFMISDGGILYSSELGYETDAELQCDFQNGSSTDTNVSVWPEKGHVWTKEEIENVKLLAQTISIFGGYAKLSDKVKKAEITDTLTGISNAAGTNVYAAKLVAQGKIAEVTCIFINLKNFKFTNKQVTPRGGDKVLIQYGQQIVKIASYEYEFAGRLGGDNFIMLVQHSRVAEVIEKISRIQASVIVENRRITVPVESRAGYVAIREGEELSDGINKASIALNFARRIGKNYVVFEPYMLDITLHDKKVSSSFVEALVNKEFVVYYQPKVNVLTKKICGSEALVRWFQDGKMVPPMEFIPVLEREGTICQLDFYVLDAVCAHIRKWIDEGIEPVKVSVNFSRNHLHNAKVTDQIINTVKSYNIPPQYIEIELTEMSDYEDYKVMENFVNQLKTFGIASSIDDFGTGYSSMTLLRDLNVDTVKLDRSFVVNLKRKQQKDRVMIETVAQMVKAFGMEVLVEGVETTEQFEYLKSVGCDVIQGYLFDRPMPQETFRDKLEHHRKYA